MQSRHGYNDLVELGRKHATYFKNGIASRLNRILVFNEVKKLNKIIYSVKL